MSAMQTVVSASLAALLAASLVPTSARAEGGPEADAGRATGEVRDEGPDDAGLAPAPVPSTAPGETAPVPLAPPGETSPVPPAPLPAAGSRHHTGRFEIGAGASTEEGFVATATIAQDDFLRMGHHLVLSARMSGQRQLATLGYEVPHLLGSTVRVRGELYSGRQQLPGFTREASGGGVTLSAPLGPHVEGFLGYRLERLATSLVAPVDEGPRTHHDLVSAVRVGLAYSTLDAPVLPTRGSSLGVAVEMADPRLGSDVQLMRLDGWASTHVPLGPLILHLGGAVHSVSSRDPGGVPLGARLQLDGASELRGFAPGSLGPIDPRTGVSTGGTFGYSGRAELEAPISRKLGLSAVGFVDVAAIYDPSGPPGMTGGQGTSVGLGVIWRSPIGPLRFDWAVPLDGGRPRFGFGIGSSF